jgi:hypothetical protein
MHESPAGCWILTDPGDEPVEDEVNAHPYRLRVQSNGSFSTGFVVWLAKDVTCCDTQGIIRSWRTRPGVWDPSSMGSPEIYSTSQCGGCGQRGFPPYARLVDAEQEIDDAAEEIDSEYQADGGPGLRPEW